MHPKSNRYPDAMTLINTPCGEIRGTDPSDGVCVFTGIRFASAEGFRPPTVVTNWSGIYEANVIGPECEDCLFLNITPPLSWNDSQQLSHDGNDASKGLLGAEMSSDLLSLGRLGDPNWQPYNLTERTTKIFDMPCAITHSQVQYSDNLIYNFWMNP